jgi:hypothetical protein
MTIQNEQVIALYSSSLSAYLESATTNRYDQDYNIPLLEQCRD